MNTRQYKVLLTTACFEPGVRAGGPIKSVARIIDTVTPGISIEALTSDRDLGLSEPYPGLSGVSVRRGCATIRYIDKSSFRQWWKLLRRLRRNHFDLLYCNSLWEPYFSVIPIVAARIGLLRARTILIAPRGELSSGALQQKSRKKRAFLRLWQPILAGGRVRWHASTEMEARDIRAVWPEAQIEVVEDQTDLPAEPTLLLREGVERLRAVSIGRISPMKNLILSLEALARCAEPIDFEIFGPIEDASYWEQCQDIITSMPPSIRIKYSGALDAATVRQKFAEKDVFLFPTLGENFGHVVPESLSASCVVLASDRTPWNEVLNGGGGIAISDITPEKLSRAIDQVAALSPQGKFEMRRGAAKAYQQWRSGAQNENILDRMRSNAEIEWSKQGRDWTSEGRRPAMPEEAKAGQVRE